MRYDNWDVILFPRDSLVPIQEFRTACYASQDEQGRQLSTLTCYISSLPTATPFRISIHSWATPAKPSALIESRRKTNQRVVFTTQVIVDGARVFHGFYEINSKWPQEIMTERRLITDQQVQSSRQSPCLEFPPFHQNVLWQSSWDAREHTGRVKVLLSEQLIRKTNNSGELDFGASNDIVCFAFQHAPKDILEQAGVSWPIRNPLYLPSTLAATGGFGVRGILSPQVPMPYTKPRDFATETRTQSPLSRQSQSTITRPRNPEPYARPRTDPPQFSQFPKPPGRSHLAEHFADTFDEMSMDSWSTRQPSSHSIADISMSDLNYSTPLFSHAEYLWRTTNPQQSHDHGQAPTGNHPRQEKRQVVVTLRDDQLGQIIEAISPPKPSSQRMPPPKMAGMSVTTRPSAASLARKASYPDLSMKNQLPCGNEDARPPTAYPHANRVPTPHPFVAQPQATWDSDVSMRDTSSVFSNLTRQLPVPPADHKSSPAQVPSAYGNIKSKKEGMHPPPGAPLGHDTRHGQSPLSELDDDKQFVPGHKGM
ncbi:hypothetical protein K458DRAFT_344276, partial [Lentithecium fluviatile CBS 122367]